MTLAINYDLLITALEKFLEADQADRRDRAIAAPARKLEAAMAKAFKKQGVAFLKAMDKFKGSFSEAPPKGVMPALSAAQVPTWSEMTKAMQEAISDGLEAGGDGLMDALDIPADDLTGFGFDVMNPEAIKYAKDHAAEQVTKINDVTKDRMRGLITRGVEEGWSYGRLTRQIKTSFDGMTSARARRIAVFELRDAYETGQRVMIDRLGKHGLDMETSWLTAGDDRVRDSHRASAAEGWQEVGYVFSSGGEHPPTDPGCRCTSLYRRKK
jgi:uncharacterized protein with gpF-like domain